MLIGFSSKSLVFCEQKSDLLVKKSESLPSLFCHEQRGEIAHGPSFVKNDGSDPAALLSRATSKNHTRRSLKKRD